MTYQQTIIVGNLGHDPELKYFEDGNPVANFPVAVNERWYDRQSGGQREKTTWFRVAVYGSQAENVAKYLSKGKQVMVVGRIEARAYTNRNGEPAASLELRARDVRFLQGGDTAYSDDYGGGQSEEGEAPNDMGDIPF